MGKDKVSKPWYVFTQYSPLPISNFTNGAILGGGPETVVVGADHVVVRGWVVLVVNATVVVGIIVVVDLLFLGHCL